MACPCRRAEQEALDDAAAGGLKQTLFSGEGLVMRFRGRGRIWLQTRTLGQTTGIAILGAFWAGRVILQYGAIPAGGATAARFCRCD